MPRRRRESRAPTLSLLAAAVTAGAAVIALLLAVALLRTSAMVEDSTENIVRDATSQALASEAQLNLLVYQRISNLYALTREPELARSRPELVDEMRRLLAEAGSSVSSLSEEQLIAEVSTDLELYLQERALLESQNLEIEDLLRLSRPPLERTVERLNALLELNEAQVLQAQAEAVRWNRIFNTVTAVAAFVLVGGLLALAFGLHRLLLRPILHLHDTIEQFRTGTTSARARSGGLQEVQQLALGFNEMADALAKQRENQLAFLAGVAHDLKSPLSALRIGIEAIALEHSEIQRDQAHAALDRQVEGLSRMVDDLLDATRIEAGSLDMRIENFDVRDAIQDMVRLYAPTSPAHSIRSELPPEPVTIEADRLRVEQIVSNLLSNAIKFSPRGGPITVTVENDREEVRIAVTDQGVGIHAQDQPEIFLPFRRRKAEVAPGAGLGLSVVRRIVEAHGGRIDVESRVDCGSVFRVTLRRKLGAGDRAEQGQETEIA